MARASAKVVDPSTGKAVKVDVGRGSASIDEESRLMIFQGCNTTQLCTIFRTDPRTLMRKLFENNVRPCGVRNGSDIYHIADVAPYIVKPHQGIEEAILKMSHHDLPKDLTKEFWAGQRSKQDFLEKAGRLWPTEKVVERVSELLKLVKMSTLLMNDAVERQTELTEQQRSIIKSLTRGMLEDLMKRVEEQFKPEEHVQAIPHGQPEEVIDPDL